MPARLLDGTAAGQAIRADIRPEVMRSPEADGRLASHSSWSGTIGSVCVGNAEVGGETGFGPT